MEKLAQQSLGLMKNKRVKKHALSKEGIERNWLGSEYHQSLVFAKTEWEGSVSLGKEPSVIKMVFC